MIASIGYASYAAWLLRGMLLGLSVAAPVGPIGVLCIRRTLAYGRRVGFLSGLGAATADMCYGAVAAFGLVAISSFLVAQQMLIRGVGGAFLVYLGARTALARPSERVVGTPGGGYGGMYASTLLLTLTNPLTILSFTAIFAAVGLGSGEGSRAAGLLVVGVFLGSALWWLVLSTGIALLRERVGPRFLRAVNLLSGTVLLAFGALALASVW